MYRRGAMHRKAGRVFLAAAVLAALAAPGRADDPAFLTVSAGWFDLNRQKDQGGEFGVEYRSGRKFGWFKPFAHAAGVTNGMTFLGAGVLVDVYFGRRWVVSPGFAPTWWRGKTSDLDLGHGLEFRSRLEAAYRFDDRSRLGLSFSHSSNAGLGDSNPGTESLMISYSLPISALSGLF